MNTTTNENDENHEENNVVVHDDDNDNNHVNKPKDMATRYATWEKVATTLAKKTEEELAQEELEEKKKLGLDGKYARSQAEAEERQKLKDVKKVKKTLDKYKKREEAAVQSLVGILEKQREQEEKEFDEEKREHAGKNVFRITRHDLAAGTRVVRVRDTSGISVSESTIVLTQDLSHLESKMRQDAFRKPVEASQQQQPPPLPLQPTEPKKEPPQEDSKVEDEETEATRSVFGVIKAFFQNVQNCTILVKCKIISGFIELHHCHNVVVKIMGPEATVATVQADLSSDVVWEFHDVPSGKNVTIQRGEPTLYWGQDKDDRVFHAGVSNMTVRLIRDGIMEQECTADYLRDGATPVGNATAEEMQFVTSVVDGKLCTEAVLRTGSSTGKQVRAMTQREIDEEKERRAKAAALATTKAEEMIEIKDKYGNAVVTKTSGPTTTTDQAEEVQEVLSPEIQAVVDECLENRKRGNEAFQAGEYGQAILLYTLALDKSQELPLASLSALFPVDVVYSNRAACFLKLGQHEKAESDAAKALSHNPDNIKAMFRQGLALHALHRYQEALPLLAKAYKREPHNKQIKQALQFCEVRLEQELRQRMNAGK